MTATCFAQRMLDVWQRAQQMHVSPIMVNAAMLTAAEPCRDRVHYYPQSDLNIATFRGMCANCMITTEHLCMYRYIFLS